jgi:hypothetical protein
MEIRRLLGITALCIAAGMTFFPVIGGFSMTGLHAGLVLFCGLGGLWLTVG